MNNYIFFDLPRLRLCVKMKNRVCIYKEIKVKRKLIYFYSNSEVKRKENGE